MDPNYFNPSMYQNVPASEVNWAQLAQRWIVARNLAPSNVPTPRPLMGGPVQPPAFPSPYMDPKSMHTPNVYPPMPMKPPPVNIIYPPAHSGFFSRPALNVMPPNMPYGLPPPIRSGLSAGPSTSYVEPNFICEDEEEQYGAHFDPSLTSDDAETEQNETGAMSHWISGMTETSDHSGDLPHDWMDPSWMPNAVDTSKFHSTSGIPSLMSLSFLNQQDRKKLPAWILEGLEKAEKEKQKKLEKEERLKEAEKNAKLRQEQRAAMGLSKFDSDSDAESDKELGEETTNYETKNLPLLEERDPILLSKRGFKEELDKDEEQSSEDEEKREELKQLGLMTIRRLMTAVLLESTDEELNRIASQIYSEAKSRAQPKILVQSSALAALSALGDGESESSDEETDNISATKNSQNHKSDRDAATFKAPSLPTVPKLRSGELSNGSNSLATVERENLKHNVESTVKGESVDRREDKNMKSNEIPPKHASETRSGKRDRSDERDGKEHSKSHKERSKRSRSRSRERTSKRDKDRDNGRKRGNRKRDDDDLRQRGDSTESSKKHRHNVEDRKRSRSRSRSRDRAHRSSKHSRRRSRSSS